MTDEHADLRRARQAAHEVQRAAAQLAEYADRMGADLGPADMAEYDTLVARETSALSERVEAFQRLGLGVPSLED
jgi:hypothetical protein